MRCSATILALVVFAAAGCAAPLAAHLTEARLGEARPGSRDDQPLPNGPRAASVRKAQAQGTPTQEEAFAGILEELEHIRAIDPEAERKLIAELKEAKPEHYAGLVQVHSAALAFRQQLAERQQRAIDDETLVATDDSLAQLVSHESSPASPASLERESLKRASAVQTSLNSARNKFDASRYAETAVTPARYAAAPDPEPPLRSRPSEQLGAAGPSTPKDHSLTTAEVPGDPAIISDRSASDPSVKAASATVPAADWRSELTRSIADLEKTISTKPTSVAELHDHMRLRTLQLLAGRQEEAFRPIPGASADQQDYWSKQLFAMSAYLDANSKLDDKQRSTAALSALDDARAKLADLSTLQVRNAAFVSSVDGFGAYEPVKATRFQPGQKVALYAEVENFRSTSAEDGYHTSLATSYQVVEAKSGRRIEGKQFPDIADKCRNRRRDFHMQYEFPLPTKIYPGEYQLELTITDHSSGKIGQTSIPFEIVGEP